MGLYPPTTKTESDHLLRLDSNYASRTKLEERSFRSTDLLHYLDGSWKTEETSNSKFFVVEGKLQFTNNDDCDNFYASIPLIPVSLNLGGERYLFECPDCKKRVNKLYLLKGKLACRHCHNLTYTLKQIGKGKLYMIYRWNKAVGKARKIGRKMRKKYKGKETRNYKRQDKWYWVATRNEMPVLGYYYDRREKERKLRDKGFFIKRPVDCFTE